MGVEVLSGRNVLLFFRERAKHETEDAARLQFQTEHSISKEKETNTVITKDGPYTTVSDGENTADITSLAYRDEEAPITTWEALEDMFDRNARVEMWQVDITGATSQNLDVEPTYYLGSFSSFELSAPADGEVELSFSFAINGNGVKGADQLTAGQLASIESTIYEYETMKATDSAGV